MRQASASSAAGDEAMKIWIRLIWEFLFCTFERQLFIDRGFPRQVLADFVRMVSSSAGEPVRVCGSRRLKTLLAQPDSATLLLRPGAVIEISAALPSLYPPATAAS